MASFFYTAAMQTEKSWLNNMTTNLPAKTALVMVVPAAAAVEMVVVRKGLVAVAVERAVERAVARAVEWAVLSSGRNGTVKQARS